jgi:hypothetical protein
MLLSLAVSGATAASRQAAMAEAFEEEVQAESAHPTFEALPDAEDGSQTMTPVGAPNTEESAVLTAGLPALKVNDDVRLRRGLPAVSADVSNPHFPRVVRTTCNTCASVSSSLGRQFTLVGARPSGTG